MVETKYYAVFLFPQALENIGEAIKPYLRAGPPDVHLIASQIDAGGPLFGMILPGQGPEGQVIEIEIMVPHNFVRLVMSVRGEQAFGFV
jgi:hypothetical protein